MKKFFLVLLVGCFVTLPADSDADLVFDIVELGGNVELTVSGFVDLNATQGFVAVASNTDPFIVPTDGSVAAGDAVTSDYYDTGTAWTPFGTGGVDTDWDVSSGDRVALFVSPYLGVPLGYVSGNPLSATATKFSATFASLGLTLGSHQTVFSNGQNVDTVTVNIGSVRVPEPSSLLLLGTGLAMVGVRYRRRKK